MDDFVRTKLVEWGLSEWVEKFKDEQIDAESLYELDDREIDNLITKAGPRVKFKKRLKLLKGKQEHEEAAGLVQEEQNSNQETVISFQCEQEHEEAAGLVQVLPSTSDTGKRKSDLQSDASRLQSPAKRQRLSIPGFAESIILSDVKSIMTFVHARLNDQDKLSAFLKKKISDLETDKRELVGVFGKTGAGKSSLINAIIKEKNLLPSGSINACTSVMIKVEANTRSTKYEVEIEFITKEEWKEELWSFQRQLLGNNKNQDKEDDDYHDAVEKLSALYGEDWRRSFENLMENKYFKEIPEFLQSRRKILTCESANELSAQFVKYTRSESKQGEGNEGKTWFWPLVKCVTVRVPNNPFLQHVTLVDLPGNGDCNKSRDQMWKGIVGDCSTVWIVTDINRAASEKEAWEILESVSSLIGNGGECQQIHFICTKSDLLDDSDDLSSADIHDRIVKRNIQAKSEVKKAFNKRTKIKKHFTDDSFKVFTVSSREFLKGKHLNPEETEITKLQRFLQELNDCHSETVNYVSGAYGILSLIQGANSRGVDSKKSEVFGELERIMNFQLENVRKEMEETIMAFEKCLNDGVEKSKGSYGEKLKNFLYRGKKGGAFHRVLKCVVENGGIHKPKNGKLINLNMKLASCLTDSIDEEFRKTFPNDSERGAFNGVIDEFSLNTNSLIEKYKSAELQLRFLKTEEEKIKAKLNRMMRKQKKKVYSSLTETIEDIMEEGYCKAAEFEGEGTLYNMRETITDHVHSNKDMFEQAKNTMLEKLHRLKVNILEILEKIMKESIESSFKTDGSSLPDVSTELEMVKKYYDQLAATPDDETSLGRQAGVVDPKCRTQTQGMNSKAFISALFAGTGKQAYKGN
ncbi:nuclear GTPase SLIP-GC-like isoform X1 [Simochromis diagramma]|uniref:nuclear GTPase SLIP-GC-like isoform X1 n=1 Tax=Simochromis diagramma TaxID=43689 RepID=UPI001A7ECD16|nr:nuclear GTPase SLIP-GC-like isoform X1 [Simochromis diagramma]